MECNGFEVVFSHKSKYACEIPSLITYGSELFTCLTPLEKIEKAGIFSTEDGYEWRCKLIDRANLWTYQIFNKELYIATSSFDKKYTFILKYNGSEFKEVLKLSPGGGGGSGLVESLGVFKDYLFAGRRNEIWRSLDGERWEKVFEFSSNKSLYQFLEYEDKFYSFEGEPIRKPCNVYVTDDGRNWKLYKTYDFVEWFRSHSPSDRVVLDYPYIADGRGNVYFFNGRLNKILERRFTRQPHNVAVRLKTLEDRLFILYGAGTCASARGEVWVYDGFKLSRILTLPYGVYDIEIFKGYLYLACNNWSNIGGFCESFVLKVSPNLREEQPPLIMTLTSDGKPLIGNLLAGSLIVDAIPIHGYKTKILHLLVSEPLILEIEAQTLSGSWIYYDRVLIKPNVMNEIEIPFEGKMIRFKLTSLRDKMAIIREAEIILY